MANKHLLAIQQAQQAVKTKERTFTETEVAFMLKAVQKGFVDKAVKWLQEQGKDWWEGYGLPFNTDDFRKAMEE